MSSTLWTLLAAQVEHARQKSLEVRKGSFEGLLSGLTARLGARPLHSVQSDPSAADLGDDHGAGSSMDQVPSLHPNGSADGAMTFAARAHPPATRMSIDLYSNFAE